MSKGSLFRRPTVMLALALCSVGAVVTLMGRLATGPKVEQKRVQISSGDSAEDYPSFSPDGRRLAYSARQGGKIAGYHVFVRELPSGSPKQLTRGDGNDVAPVFSPDGAKVAFLRVEEGRTRYIIVPADGGEERPLGDSGPSPAADKPAQSLSWSPDGNSLAVVQYASGEPSAIALVAATGGRLQPLTKPAGAQPGDTSPAIAPSGSTLAFVRHTENGGDIFLCDINGENVRRLTFDDKIIRGIAWSHDGQDLIYSSPRARGWSLWRVPAYGGSPRELTIAGQQAYCPAVGRNRLAYTDSPTVSAIWRAKLDLAAGEVEEHPIIRSTGRETSPVYSPDGTKIVNVGDQTGNDEIYLSDAEGRNRVQLTHLNGPRVGRLRWSPDSKTLIFDASSDHGSEVFVMLAATGSKPARVLLNAGNASISNDGKRIYFQSRGQLWKATIQGSNPETITREMGAGQPIESADGKWIFFRARRSFYRVSREGGEAEETIVPDHDLTWSTTIQPVKKGVYYAEWERSTRSMVVSFYDFAAKKSSVAFRMQNQRGFDFGGGSTFSVSPDGKYLLYARVDQSQTNLMLVENFR
ncbi:MAG TPA: LpqB family beta-propeller domain-containing protein [Candidatus Acidoferrales bacterium]|nr:LpqB family beta-propeller domain-containing protein [Candidatus Acidoferrales bacterium]